MSHGISRREGPAGRLPGSLATIAAMVALLAPCLLIAACSRTAAGTRVSRDSSLSGPSGSVDRKPAPPEDGGPGLRLLRAAAEAGSTVSYQGVEMVSTWGVTGDSTMIAGVWHRSGGSTLVQAAVAGVLSPAQQTGISDDTDSRAPEGVLGVTAQLVSLLGANYDLSYEGPGSADSRPAQMVEVWREDGSLAARFWLDQATKLPLRREVFDSSANLIGEDVFIDRTVGAAAAAGPPTAPARGATAGAQLTAVNLTSMRARGWPVPAALPDRLSLFEAGEAPTRSGEVLDLCYSDGLFVVSVFMQRGDLPAKLTGWQKATLDGRHVYTGEPGQRSITWAGQGFVFTVMADAPPATLNQAVDTLPYDRPPGVWGRLSRGFGRLASWANPFG
jgi:sigma-E factor negative regulatory protein RseB